MYFQSAKVYFSNYTSIISNYKSILSKYKIILSICKSRLSKYTSILSKYKSRLSSKYKSIFSTCSFKVQSNFQDFGNGISGTRSLLNTSSVPVMGTGSVQTGTEPNPSEPSNTFFCWMLLECLKGLGRIAVQSANVNGQSDVPN